MSSYDKILEYKKIVYNNSSVRDSIVDKIEQTTCGKITDKRAGRDGFHFVLENATSNTIANDVTTAIYTALEEFLGREPQRDLDPRKLFNLLETGSDEYVLII